MMKKSSEILATIRELGHVLAEQPDRFLEPLRGLPTRQGDAESITAEVLPLADACVWLASNASRVLRVKRVGFRGRPWWLWGVVTEVRREARGNVLILGPGNFPLFLPGVQVIQALAAGNRVWVKPSPAPGSREVMLELAAALIEAGLPTGMLTILGTDPAGAEAVIAEMDHVLLTGSEATGRVVQQRCAELGISCTMELSGCDAAYILEDADLKIAARCLAFALMLNGGATCIAPRRVFVLETMHDAFVNELLKQLRDAPIGDVPTMPLSTGVAERARDLVKRAIADGAQLTLGDPETLAGGGGGGPLVLTKVPADTPLLCTDVFAPVVSVVSVVDFDEAVRRGASCDYRLGASVFGPPLEAAALAGRLDVGCVVVNDCVVPTADPRLPFAGRGRSGFGATRGEAGLLEMTRVKAIATRQQKVYPHLRPVDANTNALLAALLIALHGRGLTKRLKALLSLLKLSAAGRPKP